MARAAITAAALMPRHPPGRTTRKATTSKSLIPWNSPFFAWVPPGENRLATARSSFLPTIEATAAAEQFLGRGHVLAVASGPVEAGAGVGIGQVAADAELLQPVEHLLGLREGEQDAAVVADVHEIVRRERISRLDGGRGRFALGTQAEDHARRDRGLARRRWAW